MHKLLATVFRGFLYHQGTFTIIFIWHMAYAEKLSQRTLKVH